MQCLLYGGHFDQLVEYAVDYGGVDGDRVGFHFGQDGLDGVFDLLGVVYLDDPDSLVVGLLGVSPEGEVSEDLVVLGRVPLESGPVHQVVVHGHVGHYFILFQTLQERGQTDALLALELRDGILHEFVAGEESLVLEGGVSSPGEPLGQETAQGEEEDGYNILDQYLNHLYVLSSLYWSNRDLLINPFIYILFYCSIITSLDHHHLELPRLQSVVLQECLAVCRGRDDHS